MRWHDLLFMHYPIQPGLIRHLIPQDLQIDSFDGSAWIGIVPFRMTGVAPRFVPSIPPISNFPELNVRTYVTVDGKPGVWFFCLEATKKLAVRIARKFFYLPYMDAMIKFQDHGIDQGKWIEYDSRRTHRNETPAVLRMRYRPIGDKFEAVSGSLEHFLTARYCLYSADPRGRVYRGEIDHPPWQLQSAEAIVEANTMTDWLGIEIPNVDPLLHFSRYTNVRAWTIERT